MNGMRLSEKLTYCDCAECGRTLLGRTLVGGSALTNRNLEQLRERENLPPRVAGRIRQGDRMAPYCASCLDVARKVDPTGRRLGAVVLEDSGPWQDNAVRALEESGADETGS